MLHYFYHLIKRVIKRHLGLYRFYRKFGVVLDDSCIALGVQEMKIGKKFSAGEYCQLLATGGGQHSSELIIGDRVSISSGVILNADCGGRITIGSDVLIGPQVVVRASNHSFESRAVPLRDQGHNSGVIKIEDDVWIGANVVILPNVTIAKGSIVAAGAVVTKSTEPYSVNGGVPAKLIKLRPS